MKKLASNEETDAMLKSVMAEIEALIEAIASEAPDCDLMLAALLEDKPEAVRHAIIKKLREMLKVRAEEKEKELDQFLATEQRIEVERKRGRFIQWLQWMMSEETIAKMRDAFLAVPMLERAVRHVGREMAGHGMNDIQLTNRNELGALSNNAPHVQPGRDKGKGTGRE